MVLYLVIGIALLELIIILIMFFSYKKPVKDLAKALLSIDFRQNTVDFTPLDVLKPSGRKDIKVLQSKAKEFSNVICDRIEQVNEVIDEGDRDGLTGCYNIAHLNRQKAEYESAENFTVIFIDVNNLKRMNDEFGHKAGDNLLKNASRKLKFWETYADLYRIGGDEFMIVLTNTQKEKIKRLMNKWYPTVGVLNRKSDGFKCVLSYGIAGGTFGDSFDTVKETADERMYKMKTKIKLQFGEEMR